MNGPRDFAELKCSDKKKADIALQLQVWNTEGKLHIGQMFPYHNWTYMGRLQRRIDTIKRRYGLTS